MIATYRAAMDKGLHTNTTILSNYKPPFTVDWSPYKGAQLDRAGRHRGAAGDAEGARAKAHRGPRRTSSCIRASSACIADRRAMGEGKLPLDWGMGETLAYATLLDDGYGVRLSGRGRRPRHVLAPPRGAARPEPREVGFRHLDSARARQARASRRSR